MIEPDRSNFGKFRDRVAWRIANFALNHIATPWYRAMIDGSIRLGLEAATLDTDKFSTPTDLDGVEIK